MSNKVHLSRNIPYHRARTLGEFEPGRNPLIKGPGGMSPDQVRADIEEPLQPGTEFTGPEFNFEGGAPPEQGEWEWGEYGWDLDFDWEFEGWSWDFDVEWTFTPDGDFRMYGPDAPQWPIASRTWYPDPFGWAGFGPGYVGLDSNGRPVHVQDDGITFTYLDPGGEQGEVAAGSHIHLGPTGVWVPIATLDPEFDRRQVVRYHAGDAQYFATRVPGPISNIHSVDSGFYYTWNNFPSPPTDESPRFYSYEHGPNVNIGSVIPAGSPAGGNMQLMQISQRLLSGANSDSDGIPELITDELMSPSDWGMASYTLPQSMRLRTIDIQTVSNEFGVDVPLHTVEMNVNELESASTFEGATFNLPYGFGGFIKGGGMLGPGRAFVVGNAADPQTGELNAHGYFAEITSAGGFDVLHYQDTPFGLCTVRSMPGAPPGYRLSIWIELDAGGEFWLTL